MFIPWAATLLFLVQAPDGGSGKAWLNHSEVWLQSKVGPRQLTHDGTAKRLLVLSPDSYRLAYVVDHESSPDTRPPAEEVIEIDTTGNVLRHILPEGYVPGPFEQLEWVDNRRIGVMTCGHANCMYWILDSDSGKTLQVMTGGFDFVWSHNGHWVARKFVAEIDAPPEVPQAEFDSLIFNEDDEETYPPPTGEDMIARRNGRTPHGHVFGPFTWSPHDSWLGFTDRQLPEGDVYVVAASPSGLSVRDTIPIDADPNAKIDWTDDTHLQLRTRGRTFMFVIDGNQLREVTPTK